MSNEIHIVHIVRTMLYGRCAACLCAAMLALSGCDTNEQQDTFASEAGLPPRDITRVDESGEVLEVDDDDWRTAPVYRGEIVVDPAEPNPVPASDFVTIRVSVRVFNAVRAPLRLEARWEDRLRRLDVIEQAADPGAYVFTFPASAIGSQGLHRLFIFDGVGEIVSYGDVIVQ